MPKENQINQGQVEAWKVIEELVERHFKLASIHDLADATGLSVHQTRRILVTWEYIGMVEKRGDMWRLSQFLTHQLPGKLQLALADTFLDFIPIRIKKGEKNAEEEK